MQAEEEARALERFVLQMVDLSTILHMVYYPATAREAPHGFGFADLALFAVCWHVMITVGSIYVCGCQLLIPFVAYIPKQRTINPTY